MTTIAMSVKMVLCILASISINRNIKSRFRMFHLFFVLGLSLIQSPSTHDDTVDYTVNANPTDVKESYHEKG